MDEIQQTQRYIQQLIDGNYITSEMKVIAYIRGSNVSVGEQTMGINVKLIPKEYDVILKRAKKDYLI